MDGQATAEQQQAIIQQVSDDRFMFNALVCDSLWTSH